MQWVKHDTDANQDAKLQNVLLDYGLEGYGLYWYCIELIAGKVDKENITFELEHDARIIARNTGSTHQKVEEMMKYFVKIGLFECSNNTITCLKLAKRLDQSMTSNPQMREIIKNFKGHDGVMIPSDKVMQDQIRSDQNRIDKSKDIIVSDKSQTKKYKFSDGDLKFAQSMYEKVLDVNAAFKKPNLEQWAHDCRLMKEREGIALNEYWRVFLWANNDHFWKDQIQSPAKLRKQYPQLFNKAKNSNHGNRADLKNRNAKLSPSERFRQNMIAAGKKPSF